MSLAEAEDLEFNPFYQAIQVGECSSCMLLVEYREGEGEKKG